MQGAECISSFLTSMFLLQTYPVSDKEILLIMEWCCMTPGGGLDHGWIQISSPFSHCFIFQITCIMHFAYSSKHCIYFFLILCLSYLVFNL